jgi:Uma2 family endonuclease
MVPDSPAIRDVLASDEVVYPVTDNMGESGLQSFVIRILQALLVDYFAALGRPVLVGGDQFFYYERGNPRACVAPDIYVVDNDTTRQQDVLSWKVWEHGGKVPTLALEIVSSDYRKDYRAEILDRYQQLGVRELIRYDPEPNPRAPRQLLTHYLRDDAGQLVHSPSPPDRVRSACFDFWVVHQPDQSLKLATGPHGLTPWLTTAERTAAAAAAEIQRLRAELARLRGE